MTPEDRQRFERIERRFGQVETQMTNQRKHQYAIEKKVDQIISILVGDEFGNSEGLVKRLAKVEERTKKIETLKNRATWIVLGASIPSGYGIWELLKKLIPPLVILLFTG